MSVAIFPPVAMVYKISIRWRVLTAHSTARISFALETGVGGVNLRKLEGGEKFKFPGGPENDPFLQRFYRKPPSFGVKSPSLRQATFGEIRFEFSPPHTPVSDQFCPFENLGSKKDRAILRGAIKNRCRNHRELRNLGALSSVLTYGFKKPVLLVDQCLLSE